MKPIYADRTDAGIYKITNTQTNKIYIGSTVNFKRRWWNHRTLTNTGCKRLNASMQKHGLDVFKFERIKHVDINGLTRREAELELQEQEQHFLDTLTPFNEAGYNIAQTANNNHQQVGGHAHRHQKPVAKFDLVGKWICDYPSMQLAASSENIIATSITDCCRGRKKSAGGYMWRIAGSTEDIPKYAPFRSILQYSKSGQLIAEWETGATAARELDINKGNITACCSNNTPHVKSAGGFVWKYKD